MKAIVYSDYGGPEVLRLVDVEKPTPGDDQILVKVRAAGLNPFDWHVMRGSPYPIRFSSGLRRPTSVQRLGIDYSGIVDAVGRTVTTIAPGDAVFGGARGALSEYLLVPADGPVTKPDNLTFEQAASVYIAGLTALQGLRDKAQLQRGQHVLINGASGGVGTFAVQLAKVLGAEVTGVQSGRNLDLVRSLGADHVIDYTKEDFTSGGERYDVVFDNVGKQSLSQIRRVLKPRGTLLANGGGTPADPVSLAGIVRLLVAMPFVSTRIRLFVAKPNRDDLQMLADLMQAGTLKPVIDECYPLRAAADAMRHLETGHARGKIVVSIP